MVANLCFFRNPSLASLCSRIKNTAYFVIIGIIEGSELFKSHSSLPLEE